MNELPDSKKDLEDRKAALKAELNKLESDLSGHITDIQEDVTETVDPRKWVQKAPPETGWRGSFNRFPGRKPG